MRYATFWNRFQLCAVNLVTDGTPATGSLLQVGILPLNRFYTMLEKNEEGTLVAPFSLDIQPWNPRQALKGVNYKKAEQFGVEATKAADHFDRWFASLRLHHGKKLWIVCWNPIETEAWMRKWLCNEGHDACIYGYIDLKAMSFLKMARSEFNEQPVQLYVHAAFSALRRELKVQDFEGSGRDALMRAKAISDILRRFVGERLF